MHPGSVRRAILLRDAGAMENPAASNLWDTHVLMLNGRDDALTRIPSALADNLRAGGAAVAVRTLPVGRALSGADVMEAAQWLRQNLPCAAMAQQSDAPE